MSDVKELIVVNLTSAIALATAANTIFAHSVTDDNTLTYSIGSFYWMFISGLLICYGSIYIDERRHKRILPKIEKVYSTILFSNLICTALFILTLGLYNHIITLGIYNEIQSLLLFLILQISKIVIIVALLTIAYYPLAPIISFLEKKVDHPLMLFGAVAFFKIGFWLLA